MTTPTRRRAIATLLTAAAVALPATAAFAHASLQQSQVPAESDQTLTMRVPGERVGEYNVAIDILVPTAFEVAGCTPPLEWTCDTATSSKGTRVTWERTVASPAGVADINFSFDVRTPTEQGTYFFPTLQTYSGGEEVAWIGREDGADRPSPRLQVGDENAPVEENDEPETDHEEPSSSPAPPPSESRNEAPAAAPSPTPSARPTASASASPSPTGSPDPADDPSPSLVTTQRPPASTSGSATDPVATVAPTSGSTNGRGPVIAGAIALLVLAGAAAVTARRRSTT